MSEFRGTPEGGTSLIAAKSVGFRSNAPSAQGMVCNTEVRNAAA